MGYATASRNIALEYYNLCFLTGIVFMFYILAIVVSYYFQNISPNLPNG